MPRQTDPNKATFDTSRQNWKKRLPTGTAGPKFIYGATEADCVAKWRKAIGIAEVRLRPGSVAHFVEEASFWTWQEGRVKPLTHERYKGIWNNQLGPVFGTVRFDEFTPNLVQEILAKCGNSVSVRDLSKTLLMQITKLAIGSGAAEPKALTSISLAKVGTKTPKRRTDIVAACSELLANAQGTYLEGPLWLMFTLGLRWGEVCGLKRVDLKGNTLTVSRQRNNKIGETEYLKARRIGERRTIGLPPELATQLASYASKTGIYFFDGPDGNAMTYQHAERKLKPFQSKTEGAIPVTMHDFRSAAIVNLYGRVDEKTYYNLFGHRAIEQTREYLDSSETQTREALQILVNA